MSNKIDRLKALANELSSYEIDRKKNQKRLKELFNTLELYSKVEDFEKIFEFKAMNLSGISLNNSSLGEISEGKYAQIIAIIYAEEEGKKRAKNVNLRYFGRVEKLDEELKRDIIEFVLRWRLEKSFLGVDHYRKMIKELIKEESA
ncbi:hypothetical protein RZR97_06525 [Hydrogenimonas thermophila]|uniref:hypothetical protein n=1 Tax=Hydrogenimonas thermophila TaxID=223786 RepID=UPI0029370343|nr:hypothetical protein [Hydrogenimonas thermophila]WOE68771.1 hypothetical protein RZR91_06545 [Hydrogenimonas thermophila]WOE71281.1 hypothetical protein RZR97_06525 [Hydrogenimonas thermophila]